MVAEATLELLELSLRQSHLTRELGDLIPFVLKTENPL